MPTKTQEKLILIDGNALVHRAFHALPPLTAPDGTVTNAVFGFSSILIKTIKDLKPKYIAATFDLAGPTFRHEQYEEYKAKRVKAPQELYDQIPLVKDVVKAFGIPVFEKQGFEADDLIGTISKHNANKDVQVIIATGDLDTLQLVEGKHVVVWTLRKGVNDTVLYDAKAIKDRYGLKPEELNDFKGLKGDASDNIPGVPGIGEKTAATIIGQYKTLEKLYEALEKESKKAKEIVKPKTWENLIENKDQAFFSRELATIVTDVKIDFSLDQAQWREHVKQAEIEELFRGFGFSSLLRRLEEIDLGAQKGLDLSDTTEKTSDNVGQKLDNKGIEGLIKQTQKTKKLGVYTDEEKTYFAADDVFHVDNDSPLWNNKMFHKLFTNASVTIVGHDLKTFFRLLQLHTIAIPTNYFDTYLASYMLNIGNSRSYDMLDIYQHELGETLNDDPVSRVSHMIELADHLGANLTNTPMTKAYSDIELPLIPILADMELAGIRVDTDAIKTLQKKTNTAITGIEKKIYTQAGTEFNISSPKQLAEILYDKLEIKGKVRKTSGGARSTAADQLEKLRDEHAIIPLIVQYREFSKLRSTYIEPFLDWVDADTSRVHTTYNQAGSATGRLSSKDPNLMNIPIKTELGQEFRKVFVAERGYRLLACDYSQIELRVAAHLAGDPILIRAFKNGEDIHTRTAATVFGVTPENVDKNQRRTAKALNFGIMYGMGVRGFAASAGINQNEARDFMDTYFAEFADMADYLEKVKKDAHKKGYVDTLFGHRRYLPDLKSTMPMLRAGAERMAVNMPMQGTAADVMKLAMIAVYQHIIEKYKQDEVRMLLQIHDELIFEVKKDLVDKIAKEVKEIMQGIGKLNVPLIVDVKAGSNWQEMDVL